MILSLASFSAEAESPPSFWIEPAFGLATTPEFFISQNYDAASGEWFGLSAGFLKNELGFFVVGRHESFDQISRHAGAHIQILGYGLGVTLKGDENTEAYVQALYGRTKYKLKNDGQFVEEGKKDSHLFAVGGRYFYPLQSYLKLFGGAEISYSSLSFHYPEGYSSDETSPIHLKFSVSCGLRFQL